jgi:hypothetical protein
VTLAALVVLVRLYGIRGAALAHLLVFIGYAAVFVVSGMHRLDSDVRVLWRALRPVIVAVATQALVTAAVEAALRSVGVGRGVSALTAATRGVVCLVTVAARGEHAPLREAFSLVRDAKRSPA